MVLVVTSQSNLTFKFCRSKLNNNRARSFRLFKLDLTALLPPLFAREKVFFCLCAGRADIGESHIAFPFFFERAHIAFPLASTNSYKKFMRLKTSIAFASKKENINFGICLCNNGTLFNWIK